MELDDDICLCFHVSLRKVKKFIRLEKPIRASQISHCYGAGTGCGWCRPYLEKLLAQSQSQAEAQSKHQARTTETITTDSGPPDYSPAQNQTADQGQSISSLTAAQYAQRRRIHVDQGNSPPPPDPSPR